MVAGGLVRDYSAPPARQQLFVREDYQCLSDPPTPAVGAYSGGTRTRCRRNVRACSRPSRSQTVPCHRIFAQTRESA